MLSLNERNRLNQYVNMFCMNCGSQVIEAQEDMLVNSNTNNSFFRVKIKKPKGKFHQKKL